MVNKEEAKIVKKIYRYFLKGNTPYKFARMLTEGGIPQYYVEKNHEPIIEPKVWDYVQ
ncbi:MAG: recombinase family protein [Anaerococcus sp.]|nr:recombinase family protein [Anaerococcus sp.]